MCQGTTRCRAASFVHAALVPEVILGAYPNPTKPGVRAINLLANNRNSSLSTLCEPAKKSSKSSNPESRDSTSRCMELESTKERCSNSTRKCRLSQLFAHTQQTATAAKVAKTGSATVSHRDRHTCLSFGRVLVGSVIGFKGMDAERSISKPDAFFKPSGP